MVEVGAIISEKYRIDRVIGRGGMGVVAVATHIQLGQQVALKIMLGSDPISRERFLREARAPMQLKSDHVCRVFDVGVLDSGTPYLVMELLQGRDLASLVAEHPLPIATAADYVLQAMIALAEAHVRGIVHRDLKPANLFLTHRLDGSPLIKLVDFGIAKAPETDDRQLTRSMTMLGSPGYMSPEQLRSARDVDARSDIWALGVILYQAVSGRLPFPATNVADLVLKITSEPPDAINIDPRFRAIVWRCLEKDPRARYQNVAALAVELAVLGGPSGRTSAEFVARLLHHHAPVHAVVQEPRPSRSRRWWLWGGAGGVVLIGLAIAHRTTDAAPGTPHDSNVPHEDTSARLARTDSADLDTELAHLHCAHAAQLQFKGGAVRSAVDVARCLEHRNAALKAAGQPDMQLTQESQAYLTGYFEELGDRGDSTRESIFLQRVIWACEQRDSSRASLGIKYLTSERAHAVDYCAKFNISLR